MYKPLKKKPSKNQNKILPRGQSNYMFKLCLLKNTLEQFAMPKLMEY